MPFDRKRADLLERSLQSRESTNQEIGAFVATVGRIPALTSPACAPGPGFVNALGIKLRAEALTLPARDVRHVSSATVARRSAARPLVLVIGRGWPRALAGATASLLLFGAVVGGASRSALPGGLLYPVRQLLDSVAVQLAGSDFDRGMTLLSQAQEHISDAAALVDRDGAHADPASLDQALLSAYDAVSGGQRALLGLFDRTGNPQALVAVQDFAARALPQLHALRPLVPADSKPEVDALIALLQDIRNSVARKAAVCGPPCASLGGAALVSSPLSAPPTGLSSAIVTGGGIGATVPGVSVPVGTVAPIPGVTASVPLPLAISSGTIAVSPPAVILGPLTVSPSPIAIPTLAPLLAPLPAPTLAPTLAPLPAPTLPKGLLGLP